MSVDLAAAAVAELYARDPESFTERRGELAAAARAAGDRPAAKAIAALRKPTRSAWVVNALVHSDDTVPARLAELADRMRAGEAELDGAAIRELSRARRLLIESLTRQALESAGLVDPTPALRDEVAATLTAALADPQVGADLAAGTLVRLVRWSGFSAGIGSAAAPVPAGPSQPSEFQVRRARELAIERASAALAAARTTADQAAAALRRHQALVADLDEQLARARSRASDAQRRADDAASDVDRARQALADLHQPESG